MLSRRLESSSKTLRRDNSFWTISDGWLGFKSKLSLSPGSGVPPPPPPLRPLGVVTAEALLVAAPEVAAEEGVPGVEEPPMMAPDVPTTDDIVESFADPDHFSYFSSSARNRASRDFSSREEDSFSESEALSSTFEDDRADNEAVGGVGSIGDGDF